MMYLKVSVLFAVLSLGFVFLRAGSLQDGGYQPGQKARDFSLKNVDGRMLSLASLDKAKGAILVFTCNHCPYSKLYEDRIMALHKKYEARGYPVVAINSNDAAAYPEDSYEGMIERAKEKGFSFAYLYDETQEIARQYGATRTPHVFVLRRDKNDWVVEYIGGIDDNSKDAAAVKNRYVEKAVDELLAGKKVSEPFTKAIGCGIKWKTL